MNPFDLFRSPALSILLAACGPTSQEPKQPDPETRTVPIASTTAGTASTAEPPERPVAQLAGEIVAALSKGKYGDVRKHFDDAMNKAMASDDAVGGMWTSIERKIGHYKRTITSSEIENGGFRIALVTCEFESATMDVKLVFDKARHLAGINLLATHHPDAFGPRPQTPKPPFAYASREVEYDAPTVKDAKMAGTLTIPQGSGPFPAVLLITGSGTQDRDSTIFGHKPFLVIADRLTRNGIAVLRVDDRGEGGSTGDASKDTVESHATDVEAGIAFLKTQNDIDPKRIGLIGHSEGGIIAAVVASRTKDVAFVVSLAGTGLPGSEINALQVEAILKSNGKTPDETIKAIVAAQRKLMNALVKNDDKAIKRALDEAVAAATKSLPEAERGRVAKSVESELGQIKSPWFRSFAALDPRVYWNKVTVPVLAMNGDRDTQVLVDVNFRAIKAALDKANNKDVVLAKFAGLNHLFQPAETGLLDEYAKIETTFDSKALDQMTEWLKKRANVK